MRRARSDESETAYQIKRDALVADMAIREKWNEAQEWCNHERRFAVQEYYLLELEGEAIGVMAFVLEQEQIRLNQFFVQPSHHRRGIGAVALCVLAAEGDRRGLPIRLDVGPDNHRAIALYRRFGFSEIGNFSNRLGMVRPPVVQGSLGAVR